jgi:beta-lactamase class A
MIKNKLFAILFVAVVSLAVGVIIGKFFFGKNKIVKTQPTEISPEIVKPKSLPLLSPITICLKGTGIIMDELSPFRYKLDEYISKAKVKTPNYSISLYFRDLNNGMWHGINYNELFSPSSLMKVPVMIAVLKACEEKKFSLKDKLPYYANNFQGVDDGYGVRKEDDNFTALKNYWIK